MPFYNIQWVSHTVEVPVITLMHIIQDSFYIRYDTIIYIHACITICCTLSPVFDL